MQWKDRFKKSDPGYELKSMWYPQGKWTILKVQFRKGEKYL